VSVAVPPWLITLEFDGPQPRLYAIAHPIGEFAVAPPRRVLVAEDDADVGMTTSAHEFGERRPLLGEDRQTRVPEIVESEPRRQAGDGIPTVHPDVSPPRVR